MMSERRRVRSLALRAGLALRVRPSLGGGDRRALGLVGFDAWLRHISPMRVPFVDLYHAREHLWNVANAVYGSGTPDGATWANQADDLLTHGQIEELVQMIEKLPSTPTQPGASRSIPEIEADYFLSNAQRMRYPTFRAKGMHLGSGIAEAARLYRSLYPCQEIRHALDDLSA